MSLQVESNQVGTKLSQPQPSAALLKQLPKQPRGDFMNLRGLQDPIKVMPVMPAECLVRHKDT